MIGATVKRRIGLGLAAGAVLAIAVMAGVAWVTAQESPEASAHATHQQSPAIAHPEVSGLRVVTREEVAPPAPAFPFVLVGQNGEAVSLGDLSGQVVLVSFLYTNCPEACPLITAYYQDLQRRFSDAIDQGRLSLVLITTDPDHDTPEHLREYTSAKGGRWLFLSGDMASLQAAWDGYGVYREEQAHLKDVVVYHSYKTHLLDAQGQKRAIYQGVFQPDQVAADIHGLLAVPDHDRSARP
ncbi:MAG: SCO family protein [Chloroflexi bacterium]|nr:SCO family protein [Chloroflexota bacterium]